MTSLSNIFKFIRLLSYVACVLFSSSAFSQALPETSSKSQSIKKPTLGYQEACILGLVQGVTEFLPISSTGHLIISAHFLNLDNPLKDPEPYNIAEPTIPINSSSAHPEILEKKTGFKQAINAYMIVIQAGSILAILFLYPKKVKSICFGLLGKDRVGAQLIRNLFFALLPSSILGLLLEKYVDRYLLNIPCVLIALVAGAGIIFAVECWRARKIGAKNSRSGLEGHQLGILPCMFIGCMQVFSMWPGMSRSMMTLTACYLVGLRPIQAAEFSFLLGLVTLSLASGYKIVSSGSNMLQYLQLDTMFIGVGIAFIASLVCVKGLVQYLTHHGLHVFAWYRLFLAMVLGVTYYIA